MDKFKSLSALFVASLLLFLVLPSSLISQTTEEDPTVIPSESAEPTVSYSDITKKAFSDSEDTLSIARSANSNEPWVEKKRTASVNPEIMVMEPFRLNMFVDHQYALIPEELNEYTDPNSYETQSVIGRVIDSTDSSVGWGQMVKVSDGDSSVISGAVKMDNGKSFEISEGRIIEYKQNLGPPIVHGPDTPENEALVLQDLTSRFSSINSVFFINGFSSSSSACENGEWESSVTRTYTNTSENDLTDLETRITIQSSRIAPIRLGNADSFEGSLNTLTASLKGDFADGVLSQNESVEVNFVFCLEKTRPFYYFLKQSIYGTIGN